MLQDVVKAVAEPSHESSSTTASDTETGRSSAREVAARTKRHHNSASITQKQHSDVDSDVEPLIDTTEILPLHSKRLERQQKRKEAKAIKTAQKKALASLSRLPAELLLQVLDELRPLDILRLQLVSRDLRAFVQEHDASLAKNVIARRYSILAKCFPRPILLQTIEEPARSALLNERRQRILRQSIINYQHIPPIPFDNYCSCMSCILAWNNLCLLVDYAHWQKDLNPPKKPLPQIERGTNPEWHQELLERHADVVRRATRSDLTYAAILQRHLDSINDSLSRARRKNDKTELFDRSEAEAASGIDDFLSRQGSPSHEIPYNREQYEYLTAYVPNRHWNKSQQQWIYYAGGQHTWDLNWVATHYANVPSEQELIERFKKR